MEEEKVDYDKLDLAKVLFSWKGMQGELPKAEPVRVDRKKKKKREKQIESNQIPNKIKSNHPTC